MTVTLILVLFGLVALGFLVGLARRRSSELAETGQLAIRLQPVDVDAFRNLVDPSEEQFLRAHLPPDVFRRIQRERLRAAIAYVSCAARNAHILVRVGEAARFSSDPAIAAAGEKLVNSAIQLRLYALRTVAKLYAGILLPGAQFSGAGVAENYERLTGLARSLGRLEYQTKSASTLP